MVRTGSPDPPGDGSHGPVGGTGEGPTRPGRGGTGAPGHTDGPHRRHKWVPEHPPSWRPADDAATTRNASTPNGTDRTRADRHYPWDEDPPTKRNTRRLPPADEPGDRHRFYPPPPPRPDAEQTRPTPDAETPRTGPRKITVTRVIGWRSRELTRRAVLAFRRAVHADGAGQSGLAALTYAVMLNYATDATVAVALANTLFFSAATAESKSKVALYLLITVAPFAVIAPVIGPALDRIQTGRRVALAASFGGQALLAVVMALHFTDWVLYPAALGSLVLSKSFNVLKSAVTPRVLPTEITLVKTNSRLTMFGLVAGAVFGAIGAGFAKLSGSSGALWFTAVVCVGGAILCLRIPGWVEVTEGEVPASLRQTTELRRQPISRSVAVSLWGNGTIRVLTGFLTLFAAFVIKSATEHAALQQVLLLGVVGAAAGIGNFAGNGVGARLHFGRPAQVVLACLGVVLAATVLAAVVQGIPTVVVLALVASTCSALAKVCLDAVIQRDLPEASRASAFGRSETILQLTWVFGGAIGLLVPPVYWIGFTVLAVILGLGLAQTAMRERGGSLLPDFGPLLSRIRPPRLVRRRPGPPRDRVPGSPGGPAT